MAKRHAMLLSTLLFAASLSSAVGEGSVAGSNDTGGGAGKDEPVALEPKSMEDLLNWAIENSDPELLKSKADAARGSAEEAAAAAQRRQDIQVLIQEMNSEPSEAELIVESLTIIPNYTLPTEKREAALIALRYLVEPIDNANDLPGLGGIPVLIDIIEQGDEPALVAEAEFVLGTAASNNPSFQQALLSNNSDIVAKLLKNALSENRQVSQKALYAVSVLLRNNADAQSLFYKNQGVDALCQLLQRDLNPGQLRKVLDILTDITDVPGDPSAQEGLDAFSNCGILDQLWQLASKEDVDPDIQERALLALINLAGKPQVRRVLKEKNPDTLRAAEAHSKQVAAQDPDTEELLITISTLQGDLAELLVVDVPVGPDRTEL